MGKLLYLDCISGIAGDMTLAALIDAGADIDYILRHLRRLPFDPFEMDIKPVMKKGISAKQVLLSFDLGHHKNHSNQDNVHTHDLHDHHHNHDDDDHRHEHFDEHGHSHGEHHGHGDHHHSRGDHQHGHGDHHHEHGHRKAADIIKGIENSKLPERVKSRSIRIFQAIAEAEGKIHGISPEEVHFHEVGAMDSIIDIIGVCLALESLDVDTVTASPVPTGSGKLRMAHGLYPIPAPATAELLRGIPLARLEAQGELTTPTGAGILKALAAEFGALPEGVIDTIGYGAGNKEFDHPNVLRCIVMKAHGDDERENVVVMEAHLDDCTGEMMGYTMERLLEAGALDVFFTPIHMKKNRPGVLITVLTKPEIEASCEQLLLTETTTLGVRRSQWTRRILGRRSVTVETRFGPVRIKQALQAGSVVHQSPEYEDAAQAARAHGVPLQAVYEEALREIAIKS
ncbi:nickel pincer cofactor biosynthesis protein LarC [Paenibacillus abyssi]|uniref:Pyridinium-3,5-bisthiocarboxylic acid mononucleotide nickel insertion protein n=1 Tax=Paenibacillus abyssi TaxID=1340531 RepID=A0A917FTA3_9BACL|nr:nickel pincer cofactor biosynthesis protein LarC [Paenibacillus abyssi]GGG00003.1 hypothetical protein GCM10010916_16560 [Paenibacillus abyssi]